MEQKKTSGFETHSGFGRQSHVMEAFCLPASEQEGVRDTLQHC